MKQIDKNTVEATNQLEKNKCVSFINENGTGVRILFAGNSITRHGVKPEIGWYHDFGMAASCAEKDYVHIVVSALSKKGDTAACIAQVGEWEQDYKNGGAHLEKFAKARSFGADIIVMRCVENCDYKNLDKEKFEMEYRRLIDYFNPDKKAHVILTTSFWKHPADEIIAAVAEKEKYDLAEIGDLGEDDNMKALGLFEHEGIANHPGDLGMEKIAERILAFIK